MKQTRRNVLQAAAVLSLSALPANLLADPPTETPTGGGTRPPKIDCCITNGRLRQLKLKIREIAAIHNNYARANKQLHKLARQALDEQKKFLGSHSGLTPAQLKGIAGVEAICENFAAGRTDLSKQINVVGNRISKAERFCNQAETSDRCGTRKARMRSALRELERGLKELASLEQVEMNDRHVNGLLDIQGAISRKLNRSFHFLRQAAGRAFVMPNRSAKRAKERFPAFKAKMLAGC